MKVQDGNVYTEVESKKDGHLFCKAHKTIWDKHVKLAIMTGVEAADLWNEVNNDMPFPGVTPVMVPYQPDMNVWAKVELREEAANGRVAYLIDPETAAAHRIGFLFPGEGRNSLRGLVHNWLIPHQFNTDGSPRTMRCRASSHAPVQHNELQRNLNFAGKQWGERWLLYFTGMCYACNKIKADIGNMVPVD